MIELTFFPKIWESLAPRIHEGEICAFKGKVDGSREPPSFLVDTLEDPRTLKEHSTKEVHIELDSSFTGEANIAQLKDFLFGKTGSCSIFFHIDVGNETYIVRANQQLTVLPDKETVAALTDMPYVKDVWTE